MERWPSGVAKVVGMMQVCSRLKFPQLRNESHGDDWVECADGCEESVFSSPPEQKDRNLDFTRPGRAEHEVSLHAQG